MIPPKYWFLILFLLVIGCAPKHPTHSVYDEKADAHRDVAAAITRAEAGKNNIVLVFGANW